MSDLYVAGGPGVRTARTADYRRVFKQTGYDLLAGGKFIDGTKAGDPGNTSDTDKLRAGLILGKLTSGGKYATSILGTLQNAEIATSTQIEVTVAEAVEIDRRIGQSGNLTINGPATAGGAMQSEVVAFTVVDVATGNITCGSLSNAYIAGSFVGTDDGSETPIAFLPDGYPLKVSDADGTRRDDIEFPRLPVSGIIDSSQLVYWPSDTSLVTWLKQQLNADGQGQYIFDDAY